MKSIINKNVSIGKKSKIWHFCKVYGTKKLPVSIGKFSQIGSYCEIKPGVSIGDYCRIQTKVFIPEQTSIADYVFLGPGVIITNDKHPTSKKTINKTYKLEPVTIKSHTTIGAGAIVGPGVTLGKHSVVGMGAVVTTSVKDKQIVVGNPAKVIGTLREKKYQRRFL